MSKEQKLLFKTFIILSVVSSVIFFFAKSDSDSFLTFISVWGSFASLFAFVFLYLQIKSQQALTREIDQKIIDTKKLLVKLFSIADISKGPKIAEQAQTFLRVEQYESALLRLKDLKEILIYIKHYNDKESVLDESVYSDHITNVTIDLSNINDIIIGKKTKINTSKINGNLEEVSTFISDFELKIKDHDF